MPSPFMQDIQEGARRGANAGWGGDARRGARADREGAPDWRLARREQGRFGLAAHQAGTGQVRLANHAI